VAKRRVLQAALSPRLAPSRPGTAGNLLGTIAVLFSTPSQLRRAGGYINGRTTLLERSLLWIDQPQARSLHAGSAAHVPTGSALHQSALQRVPVLGHQFLGRNLGNAPGGGATSDASAFCTQPVNHTWPISVLYRSHL